MNKSPLVSILILLYNAEKYFAETMELVLAQTCKKYGSFDPSLKI